MDNFFTKARSILATKVYKTMRPNYVALKKFLLEKNIKLLSKQPPQIKKMAFQNDKVSNYVRPYGFDLGNPHAKQLK